MATKVDSIQAEQKQFKLSFLPEEIENGMFVDAEILIDYLIGRRNDAPYMIVDTRWPYEYEGGHIITALNIWSRQSIQKHFFERVLEHHENLLIFFHCEFSTHRAPALATHLRNLDRQNNQYPKLDYPYIFLIKNGYSYFYEKYKIIKELFEPRVGYVQMKDPQFRDECLRHSKERKDNKKNHGGLKFGSQSGNGHKSHFNSLDFQAQLFSHSMQDPQTTQSSMDQYDLSQTIDQSASLSIEMQQMAMNRERKEEEDQEVG
ncbi:MAG: putative mitotic inducer phosphatase Cdc25 [Streblomastix strix]|uniref:Putative mitotic inducer phosphatase Cdc25 n=1 Tax=Streblomastix strix TaxID=222440 RepID=A0A5J4X4X9_9EUKA|nr:MAG: putative mitotic inducer phosphatase Cdc25 [Streblomastix strix]